MSAEVYDGRMCDLGEGPLWHPSRGQLFWFDINGKRLLSRDASGLLEWQFDLHASAAGWVDDGRLLIATERDLRLFDIANGKHDPVVALEAENPVTRSNDGRADPQGGFWIGTMGKSAEPEAGAIWRYYRGELRQLFPKISITNAICFAPSGDIAFFADTAQGRIWRARLDRDGWPQGDPELFLDHGPHGPNPDGAVVDAQGQFWVAEWGSGHVAVYGPNSSLIATHAVPARQPSCPGFGGPDLSTLFVTTARQGMGREASEGDGLVYQLPTEATGQQEHRVIL